MIPGDSHVYLNKKTAAILQRWADGINRPVLRRIYFMEGFAYFTNRWLAVRWQLTGLDIKNGSYINVLPLDPSPYIKNEKFDTTGNLAAWSKLASNRSTFDLMDPTRWLSPGDGPDYPAIGKLFTEPDGVPEVSQVAFNWVALAELSEIVNQGFKTTPVRLVPTRAKLAETGNWLVTGWQPEVTGLICPTRTPVPDETETKEATA
jgi:hypothetical protein